MAGECRVGIFTAIAVSKGAELTFDYQWSPSDRPVTRCYCGTESCRGYLEVLTEEELETCKGRRGLWCNTTDLRTKMMCNDRL